MLSIAKSDYRKTLILRYLTTGFNIVTGLILFPLIVKYLGLSELGVFGLFYSTKSIIDMSSGWFSISFTKNILKYRHLSNNISSFSFIVNFSYGLIVAFIFSLCIYIFKNNYFYSALYFSVFIFTSFASQPYQQLFTAKLNQYGAALFGFISQFLFIVTSITIFIFYKNDTLDIIFFTLAFSSLFALIFIHFYYISKHRITLKFNKINKKLIHKLFITDGVKYLFNSISTVLLLQVDTLLIYYFYGTEAVAIYLIIWKIPNTIIMLGWQLSSPFQAIIAKHKKDKYYIRKRFFSLERKILFLAVIASFCYLLLGEIVLDLWIGKEEIPNLKYMYIIPAILIIFSIMQRLYLSVNYYISGLNTTSFLQFLEIIFKALAIVFLFDMFNVIAPLFGWLIAFLFTFVTYRRNSLKLLL